MNEWLAGWVGDAGVAPVLAVVSAVLLVTFIAVSALIFIWAERKIAGRIQDRLGPTRVGGRFGWLQTLADGIKLLCKEDTIPTVADAFLFRAAPYIAFCGSFVAFLALPFGPGLAAQSLQVAVFFMLAVLASEVFGVILAGYGSGSKWSLFGAIREAAQVVSYEVPRALCVLVPICLAGTLNLQEIAQQQTGFVWNWYIFHDPFTLVAGVIFFTCATASCKRAPFDLAEAESELVAGFHTEYSGLRWSLFFMAEYGSMFAVSALAVLLFFGGWHTGLLPFEPTEAFGWMAGNVLNVLVFVLKGWVLIFVMMWARWSLPRLRIDQVMTTCLKYLLPVSCVLLLGVCLWQLLLPASVRALLPIVLASACIGGLALVAVNLWRKPGEVPVGALPGVWQGVATPLMRAGR
jgi:NADH-quinone oxidoreductase subunit H